MSIFPTDVTSGRAHRVGIVVSISHAVNMVNAVCLTGISELGWIFACFGEIQAMNNFAEKLGRPKCQFSLPMLPPKEDIGLFF